MKLTYELTEQEKSQVLLKITIDKEEIKNEYEKIISELQPEIAINGFRKGKVPRSIIEAKFKPALLSDVATRLIENAYKELIDKIEKKPIVYCTPTIKNFQLPDLEHDYTFEMSYDVFPTIKIGDYKKINVEIEEIKITEEDINDEIDKLLNDFSTVKPKDGSIANNDIVYINYTVFHDDKEFHKEENAIIYVGKDFDTFKLGNDIIGLKKGEEKEFLKTFGENEIEKLKNKTFKIKLKINEIKEYVKPELTLDLVKQINEKYQSIDDFKNDIEEELKKKAEKFFKNVVINITLDKLLQTFEGEIPQSMLERQKENYYKQLVNTLGGNEKRVETILKMQNLTKESYKEKMEEEALKELKKSLIIDYIAKKEEIQVTDDDLKQYIKDTLKKGSSNLEEDSNKVDELVKKLKENENNAYLNELKEIIEMNKTVEHLFNIINIKKGKKISLLKFEEKYGKI